LIPLGPLLVSGLGFLVWVCWGGGRIYTLFLVLEGVYIIYFTSWDN
jgi:hypothetical protein